MDKKVYPCDATRELLETNGIDFLPAGKSSNAYLAQLIVTKSLDTKKVFYTPGFKGCHEGDNEIKTSKNLLSAGENGFTYIMTKNGAPLTDTWSSTPLIFAGVKHPGIVPIFDRRVYEGKYVAGFVDGSAALGDLDENGNALSEGKIHAFQTGKDSLFGTDFPIPAFPLRGTEL